MLDAVVQFLRNFFCCIKDLDLLQDTFLWDASLTNQLYDFPAPLHKTTPLEAIISMLQLYVVVTGSIAGARMVLQSFGKIRRIERLMDTRQAVQTEVDSLINASLIKEGMLAIRSIFIGQNIFFISVSFIWLFANSWHVTEAEWIGGVAGLIHALTVMELCLIPLLYYMWKDGIEQLDKANRMTDLANKLEKGTVTSNDLPLGSFQLVAPEWQPFWSEGVSPFEIIDSKREEKLMEQEISQTNMLLQKLLPSDYKKTDGDKKKTEDDLVVQARTNFLKAKADELVTTKAPMIRLEGYREFVYLIINTIAFYGYAVSIIVYYFDDEIKQPPLVKDYLLFGYNNTDADWLGNFAGDFMWTVEPTIILTSPILFGAFVKSSSSSSSKSTTAAKVEEKAKSE